jgi:hypothetical protein
LLDAVEVIEKLPVFDRDFFGAAGGARGVNYINQMFSPHHTHRVFLAFVSDRLLVCLQANYICLASEKSVN